MKIGIMGLGNIAHRVAKGIKFAKNAELYAAASRDIQKAETFKKQYEASKAYGDYETMLQDAKVELIYICTPNMLHFEHIMLCLQKHKHVLCEKPLVSNHEQLKTCFAYAKKQGCFLMEAEKTLFTPLNQRLQKMVLEDEVIGKLKYIEAGYGADMQLSQHDEKHWLFRKEDSGSFYDVGVYPICYANFFASSAISNMQIMKHCAPQGFDLTTQAMLGYENGIMAYLRSSWDTDFLNKAYLYGEKGVIITENFWKNTKAILRKGDREEVIFMPMESDFTGEIEHAVTCIESGLLQSPVLSQKESEEIMNVLMKMHTGVCV